ncbi:MAG: TetR/AcrR family transcriptional regulator [Gaiellales bacterium]
MSPRLGRYHHGDLRAALVEAAAELIAERGVRDFSMAEASRRVGVAVSAPYAHFADRDELLAAVVVHAYDVFSREFLPEVSRVADPAPRLAALARAYVQFAGFHRPLFEAAFLAGLDKREHPEIRDAEKPLDAIFTDSIQELADGGPDSAELAGAVEATAHGQAMLLLDGALGEGDDAVEHAAERAARATLALVAGRHLLEHPAGDAAR